MLKILKMLHPLYRARHRKAQQLYAQIVAQSRQPFLYSDFGVPDTLDGRFDCILLHASMVIHALAIHGESGQILAQDLFDVMHQDFVDNLRQIGIGDLSIARHFRRMSEGFNGRLRAYNNFAHLEEPDAVAVISRNIFREQDPHKCPHAKKLTIYAKELYQNLHILSYNQISSTPFQTDTAGIAA